MVAGHFGFAAMVKSRERSAPLWALMLATAWLDIIFVPALFVLYIVKRKEWADSLAVDRVSSELLSKVEFPANREICEFDRLPEEVVDPIVMNPGKFLEKA